MKTLRVAVNRLILNRRENENKFSPALGRPALVGDLMGENYRNEELSLDEFLSVIREGRSFCSRLKDSANGVRKTENFDVADLICIDIDEGMTLEDAMKNEFITKYGSAIYTSGNHRKEKTLGTRTLPPVDRFRVIFVLDEPITDRLLYESLARGLASFFGSDRAVVDPCRLFFGNTGAEVRVLGGTMTQDAVASILERAREKKTFTLKKSAPPLPNGFRSYGKEDVAEMLRRVSPIGKIDGDDSYTRWRNIVFAVLDYLPEEEAVEVLRTWTTFKDGELEGFVERKDVPRGAKVQIGTLIREAYEAGYRPPSASSVEIGAQFESLSPEMRARIARTDTSDRSLARLLSELYEGTMIYTDATGKDSSAWYTFTGKNWDRGPFSPVVSAGLIFDMKDLDVRGAMKKGRREGSFRAEGPMTGAILKVAQGLMHSDAGKFDQANILVFDNCAIDLDNLVVVPHDRALMNTKVIPYSYDPNEKNDLFERFVAEVFVEADRRPNPEFVAQVQKFVGYAITKGLELQTFLILKGTGENGKSTFLQVLASVLGEYATSFPGDWLSQETHYPEERFFAVLRGRRLAISNEMSENASFDIARIKRLVSGDELIVSEKKYENSVEFRPTHKLILAVNSLPAVHGSDGAFFRRVVVVPTMNTFSHALGNRDDLLSQKILERPSGVVNWILEGLRQYKNDPSFRWDNLTATSTAKKEYQDEADVIGNFVEEDCDEVPTLESRAGDLYAVYQAWSKRNGRRPMSSKTFGVRLKSRPGITAKKASGTIYIGLAVKNDCEDRPGGGYAPAF